MSGTSDANSQEAAAKFSKATSGDEYYSITFIEKHFAKTVLMEDIDAPSNIVSELERDDCDDVRPPVHAHEGPLSSKPWASGGSNSPPRNRKFSHEASRRKLEDLEFKPEEARSMGADSSTGRVTSPSVKMFSYGSNPKE